MEELPMKHFSKLREGDVFCMHPYSMLSFADEDDQDTYTA
jgi:hypothetical protein